MQVCDAKTRDGDRCKNASMANGKCRMHGGASLKGIASPTLTTGRYSKYLPTRMQERYEQSRTDSELLALREDIALLDGRLADLLKRVDHGEAGAAWKEARAAFLELSIAMSTSDGAKLIKASKELEQVIGRGLSDYMAWDEISRLLEQRRKLSESERKRLVDMQNMITSEQAMLLMRAMLDSVKRNVIDVPTLTAIQNDFIRFSEAGTSQRISIEQSTD